MTFFAAYAFFCAVIFPIAVIVLWTVSFLAGLRHD